MSDSLRTQPISAGLAPAGRTLFGALAAAAALAGSEHVASLAAQAAEAAGVAGSAAAAAAGADATAGGAEQAAGGSAACAAAVELLAAIGDEAGRVASIGCEGGGGGGGMREALAACAPEALGPVRYTHTPDNTGKRAR